MAKRSGLEGTIRSSVLCTLTLRCLLQILEECSIGSTVRVWASGEISESVGIFGRHCVGMALNSMVEIPRQRNANKTERTKGGAMAFRQGMSFTYW